MKLTQLVLSPQLILLMRSVKESERDRANPTPPDESWALVWHWAGNRYPITGSQHLSRAPEQREK